MGAVSPGHRPSAARGVRHSQFWVRMLRLFLMSNPVSRTMRRNERGRTS